MPPDAGRGERATSHPVADESMPALPAPDDPFAWVPAPWGAAVLQCRPLAAVAPHFFTTRALHLRGPAADVQTDWDRVAAAIGVPPAALRLMNQVHGCATFAVGALTDTPVKAAVPLVTDANPPDAVADPSAASANPPAAAGDPPEADALVTDRPGVALVVRVADCVPLLIADPRTGAVAATHAGWRGTAANIAAATVRRLRDTYGSDPADLVAAIGPSIGACCYQVGPEVRDAFRRAADDPALVDGWFTPDTTGGTSAASAAGNKPGNSDRLRLDTWAANRDQLTRAGMRPGRVFVAGLCTATHRAHFYSYRADGPATGRGIGVIRRAG